MDGTLATLQKGGGRLVLMLHGSRPWSAADRMVPK